MLIADDGRILRFPAGDLLRMFQILKIDDAQRSCSVVGDVDVVAINVGAVHAAGDGRRVFGKNFQMRRIGGVEENDSVLAVRSALAGEYSDFFVRRGADVVDDAGVHFEGVEQFGIRGIGDVVDENFIRDGGKVGVVADNPLFRHLQVGHGDVGHDFNLALHVARAHHHRRRGAVLAAAGHHHVRARFLRDERSVRINRSALAAHRPAHRRIFQMAACAVKRRGAEVDDVAGACFGGGGLDR